MSVQIVSKRNKCRLCDNESVVKVMPINPSPIADAYVTRDNIDIIQELIPLDLYQCQKCGHVQNLDVVNPEYLFKDYTFHTSNSESLISHFNLYADNVLKKINLEKKSLVVEIGSNDGTLLNFFKEHGFSILGVDPAVDIARKANKDGVPTINNFFSSELAANIKHKSGSAQLIVANNVYAHADNLDDITKGVELLLSDNGVFIFEVSYLLDIIDHFLFDTVYHEHLSYHSLGPLSIFLNKHGLEMFDVEKIGSKGGSIRCFVQKNGGIYEKNITVSNMIAEEIKRGLHLPNIFYKYSKDIKAIKNNFFSYLEENVNNEATVIGYGASTTVTTLMYHFDLTERFDYLVDDNELKHGLYSPGAHIEVKPSSFIYEYNPDFIVILAWQYADQIISKHTDYLDNGGVFLVPLPELIIYKK